MNQVDQFFTPDPRQFADHYFRYLSEVLDNIDRGEIAAFVQTLLDARERDAHVWFIGNGGSAATASHFANDIGIGTRAPGKPFRIVSLCDNQAVITAIGNDFGYADIFSRQLAMVARPGDVVVAISASGNSPNLVDAFTYAKANGITCVALTAFSGGKLREMQDLGIHVPTEPGEYGPAEDAHMILDHLVANYLLRLLAGTSPAGNGTPEN